ncbi:MAG: GAF domain-containing sensor histidine kinase [Anaerolineae bacterium]|nr:GAF domain-containing sensor histidine kinase [Anaerolineae bacterium]
MTSHDSTMPPPELAALQQERDALQREIDRYHALQRIYQDLVSEVDIDHLLHHILRTAVQLTAGTAGSLILLDEITDELVFRVVEGGGGDRLIGTRMGRHQGIAGWVLQHKQTVVVDDTRQDHRFYAEVPRSVGFAVTSMICAPMIVRGKAIGVIQVLNKQEGHSFSEVDQSLLATLAAQSAIALRNAQLYQDLREERDRLVALEEDLRRDLARDLHDGPTQLVAAIAMNLQFIHRLLDSEPDKVAGELEEIESLAKRAMHQLRSMLFDLRPVILETKGLIPALQAYCTRLAEVERFAVHFDAPVQIPPLTAQASSAVFAVVQEAVTNARKHADGGNIWLSVHAQDNELTVAVRDDGVGFDPASLDTAYRSHGSLGMVIMRERAALIQGTLSIQSAQGKGTTVRLAAPLGPNLAPEDNAPTDPPASPA